MSSEPPQATTTTTIGNVVLVERIGRGGMGEVWRGERLSAGGVRKRVAVKRILASYQRDATLRARFVAEARTTARLEHPNVVQLVDFGDSPELYLVLEYVEGTSLDKLLARAARGVAPFPLAAALYVVAEAAEGLDYAHRRTDDAGRPLGIVHRDVSPHNILVSTDGTVKVSDFGIAWAADNQVRTREGFTMGKVLYMSPQQAQAQPLDRRADVFALGVVLWEALTLQGLLPRGAPDAALAALAAGKFPPPSSAVPDLHPALDAIVRDALAADPDARTPSAGRLAAQLRTVLDEVAPGYSGQDLARVVADLMPEWRHRRGASPPSDPEAPAHRVAPPAPAALPEEAPTAPASPRALAPQAAMDGGLALAAAPDALPAQAAAAAAQMAGPKPPSVLPPGLAPAHARAGASARPAARRASSARVASVALLATLLVVGAIATVYTLTTRASDEPSEGKPPRLVPPANPAAMGAPPGPPPQFAPAPVAPPPPPVAPSSGAPEALVTNALLAAARACASEYTVRVPVTGTAVLDARYTPVGTLERASVRVEGTRVNRLMAVCIQSRLHEQPIGPTPGGVNVAAFTVAF